MANKKLLTLDNLYEYYASKNENATFSVSDDAESIVVQVNGKLRDKVIVKRDITKEEMEEVSLKRDNIIKFVKNKEIIKVISVPNKLVNIVVK